MCHNHECHNHNDEEKHLKYFKIIKIILSIFLLSSALIIDNYFIKDILFITAYLIAGITVITDAIKHLFKGNLFDENFLMSIATIGAICLKEFPEAVSVMILYQIGEYLQDIAVDKTRKSISGLMKIKPEYANIEKEDGLTKVHPEEVNINDIIIVKPGEKIPLDGKVIDGSTYIDTSSLTGESVYKPIFKDDDVLSGCINLNSTIKIKVTKTYKDSAVSKILELVENAEKKKSKTEKFITKFSKIYTPMVVAGAVALILIPYLIGFENITIWIERALTFLIISCPCALVISVPLSFIGGIGAASREGILIKGSNYLEILSKPNTIAFDKTGTLTKGKFKVTEIKPNKNIDADELIEFAAYSEYYSNHPAAIAIKEKYNKNFNLQLITYTNELAGYGIESEINGHKILIGNKRLLSKENIDIVEENSTGTVLYISKDFEYIGCIIISDEIKEDAYITIKKLKDNGIKTIILTGDLNENAKEVKNSLNVDSYIAELLPENKVEEIEKLKVKENKNIIFVGDGINDAPVIMSADIGIAMGALGSDAAIEAADIVIIDDKLTKVNTAINIAKRTIKIAKENIFIAISVKFIFLILGSIGLMTMWGAIFADVGITLIAIGNSLRTLKRF